MQDLNDFRFFVAVVEHGGFAAAGRALGVPKSRLSRRIAGLEERLGVRLLQRSTRRFSITDVGARFLARCKAMLREAEAAEDVVAMTRAEPSGVLRITCPVTLLDMHVGGLVASFLARHPNVTLHLEATDRRVDVIEEGVDLALRVRVPPLADSGLVLRRLGAFEQSLVASPALLALLGTPAAPADLGRFPGIAHGVAREHYRWHLFGPGGASADVAYQPRLVTRGMLALRDAAIAGVGIVQLPTMVSADAVAAGLLVPVLAGWGPQQEIVHAVFPSRHGQLPSLRAFVDHLVAGFRPA